MPRRFSIDGGEEYLPLANKLLDREIAMAKARGVTVGGKSILVENAEIQVGFNGSHEYVNIRSDGNAILHYIVLPELVKTSSWEPQQGYYETYETLSANGWSFFRVGSHGSTTYEEAEARANAIQLFSKDGSEVVGWVISTGPRYPFGNWHAHPVFRVVRRRFVVTSAARSTYEFSIAGPVEYDPPEQMPAKDNSIYASVAVNPSNPELGDEINVWTPNRDGAPFPVPSRRVVGYTGSREGRADMYRLLPADEKQSMRSTVMVERAIYVPDEILGFASRANTFEYCWNIIELPMVPEGNSIYQSAERVSELASFLGIPDVPDEYMETARIHALLFSSENTNGYAIFQAITFTPGMKSPRITQFASSGSEIGYRPMVAFNWPDSSYGDGLSAYKNYAAQPYQRSIQALAGPMNIARSQTGGIL